MGRMVGVKCYGYDWINVHGMSMRDAAVWLRKAGVDWALVQNQIDPVPGSEVAQALPSSAYDDVTFRARLRDEGIRVFETTVVFHDPMRTELNPVDANGWALHRDGWYAGLCPSDPAYVKAKAERVARVVDRLEPEGVFVSFIRFPGFWELWMPSMERAAIAEYCFCDRCLGRFQLETGNLLPGRSRVEKARVLLGELRAEWTSWKCAVIADAVRQIREAAGVPILLNGFGLGQADFGNAVEEVLAQRFADLDPVVDFYELMFYFQIQRRDPATWIPARLAEARSQTARPIFACLQAGAEYLAPKYAPDSRAASISEEEWMAALRAASEAGADGVLVYSWRDLLKDESRVRALKDYRNGLLQRG